jgi:nucleoside 2-deoxyribosyltransferase
MSFSLKSVEELLQEGVNQEWVYVAGPVTKGNWMRNLRNAIDAGERITAAGFLPVIPHYSMLLELIYPDHDYNFMLYRVTLPFIKKCDYLVRIPGDSSGGDKEVEYATSLEIPVFFSIDEFLHFAGKKK